jgi:hypothetical protein
MDTILKRLLASFDDLEKAINTARKNKNLPEVVSERIKQYDVIIAKQRIVSERLAKAIKNGDWNEVNRHVGIINGLSNMIRVDARDILGKYFSVDLEQDVQTEPMC